MSLDARHATKPTDMVHTFKKDFFILYVVTFVIILPLICFELEHSMYHSVDRENMIEYRNRVKRMNETSKRRLEQAKNYLQKYEAELEVHEKAPDHADGPLVMITIITVSRKFGNNYDPEYVTQVSGRMLQLMHEEIRRPWLKHSEKLRLRLALCNVDSKPQFHTAIKHLSKFIPTFTKYNDRVNSIVETKEHNLLEKEKLDFTFCLQKSLESANGVSADYVLLMEDDAYPLDDLFPVLSYQIYSHLEHPRHKEILQKNTESIAYVKLYHPKRLQGYISLEADRLPEVLALGMVCGTLLTLMYSRVRPIAYSFSRTKWIDFSLLILVVYSAFVALAIGKQNLQWFRRLSKYFYVFVPTPSCCTPAMLFPRRGATRVIEGLSQIHCHRNFAKDLALDSLLSTSNLTAYMVSPSLFEHIGMYSTLHSSKLVDPIIVP